MANGYNKVILIGNLGMDPELRHTQSNQPVARMRIATTETWTDRSGTQQKITEWHNVVAWGKSAELVSKYLTKGRQVCVEGKLRTRKWQDKDGKDRYTTEIIAQRVVFLGGRAEGIEALREDGQLPPFEGVVEGEFLEPFASDFEEPRASSGRAPSEDDLPF